jgi:hypothetical protein
MPGFLAALAATATFAAPVSLGSALPTPVESAVGMQPDPVGGAWVQFEGTLGEQLRRINERGGVSIVTLPAELRHSGLSLTPFRDGWALAVARRFPGGPTEEVSCEAQETCSGALVLAERSPAGRWTGVWTLPSSSGKTAYATAVESQGQVEVAWGAESGPIDVAGAPLGRPFGRAHLAQPILSGEPERVTFATHQDHLYLRAEFGPHGMCCSGAHVVERRLYPSGRLGRPHFLRSPLVRDQGDSVPGPGGSELDVYRDGSTLFVAHRRAWGTGYDYVRLLARSTDFNFRVSDSSNHHVLVLIPSTDRANRSLISAAEISPAGVLRPTQAVERAKETEGSYRWDGAIDNRGDAVVGLVDEGEGPAPTIWARVNSPRCPRYSPRIAVAPNALVNPAAPGEGPSYSQTSLSVVAGEHDVFHIAWRDAHNRLQVSSGRVWCRR